VRLAVTAAGAQDDTDIDLPGFTPPVVPTDTPTSTTVSQLDLDRASGRFTAMLTVSGDGMNPISIRISGQLEEMVQVPVAMTRLLADTVIHPSDIHMTRVRASLVQNDSARTEAQLIGMQTKRQLAAGVPLRLADLMRPPMVQRGELVDVELDSPGLSVHGKAVAVDAGADGERVRIQAQASKNFLTAQVVGPHMVRVTPDIPLSDQSIPTRFDRRTTQP
jgi:flagella basal body P-ring formation protein FlgA